LYQPNEIPSLEQIEKMERQRLQAVESLEYVLSDSGSKKAVAVKCQRCKKDIPIVGGMSRPANDRIVHLQTRQRFQETHPYRSTKEAIEETKRELAELLKEDAEADKLRNLPLYSSRITGYRFVCPECFDMVCRYSRIRR
jgi:hypothetical protein